MTKTFLTCILSFLVLIHLANAQPGAIDNSFNTGTGPSNGVFATAVQTDGKIIIGGNFTTYNGTPCNGVARLNVDGTLDFSFNVGSGTSGGVSTVSIQNDGKIIIGGTFTSYNGVNRSNIARLNTNGSLDLNFNIGTGANGGVATTSIQTDGKIIIGGFFTVFNSVNCGRLARLTTSGSVDLSFNTGTGVSGYVQSSSVQPDGKILIGGNFTAYNNISCGRLARVNTNGTLDMGFITGTGTDYEVRAVVLQSDGKIIIGGPFTTYNGVVKRGVARINTTGSLDQNFNSGIGSQGTVYCTSMQNDGKVLIAGNFGYYNAAFNRRIARLNTDGSLDSLFSSGVGFDADVYTLSIQGDGKIIAGGLFSSYNAIATNRIVRIHGQLQMPQITSFLPTTATVGDVVTISGTNFNGATAVAFGGTNASSFTIVNSTTISATIGAMGSSGNVTVTTGGGTASVPGFTFISAPTISSFTPVNAGTMDTVTITGTNFTNASSVSFGGTIASSFTVINSTTISATVGVGSSGSISITTPGGVISAPGFTYISNPYIISFTPSSGSRGSSIMIKGGNFTNVRSVLFDTSLAETFIIMNDSVITAVVGDGATGSVKVAIPGTVTSKAGFTFHPTPAIHLFSPSIISEETTVTITGKDLGGATAVKFGGVPAQSFTVVSPSVITAIAGQVGSGNVSVTTPGGTAVREGILFSKILCPGQSTTLLSGITSSTYVWQVNTGDGFFNLMNNSNYSGVNASSLQLMNLPSSFYGYQYRCLTDSGAGEVMVIRFSTFWTGSISSTWENSANWSCGYIPDQNTDVRINSGNVILNSDTTIRSLKLETNVNLVVNAGKKLKINGSTKRIEKVALAPGDTLIYGNTSGLIMSVGEQVFLRIRQITGDLSDSIPVGLTFSSTNPSIATFTSDGKVTALQTGVCKVIATNSNGKKMTCQVSVQASGIPALTDPVFAGFERPLNYVNLDKGNTINVKALNRLGQIISAPVTVILSAKNFQQNIAAGSIVNAMEGFYILSAISGNTSLIGGSSAFVYQENSNILGDFSPMLTGNRISTTTSYVPRVYAVILEWGMYPQYFSKVGITSLPIHGLVLSLVPYDILVNGIPSGAYGLTISTTEENVSVVSENNSVISGGSTITSINPGVGRWRVEFQNYIGAWYSSQVFADFSGDWNCSNDNFGHSISLSIPSVPSIVLYGGVQGSRLSIYDTYKANDRTVVAWSQLNEGTGTQTNNVTGSTGPSFNVQIGPYLNGYVYTNVATVGQRVGWGYGYLNLIDQNRHGGMKYINQNTFLLSETGNNGMDILFTRDNDSLFTDPRDNQVYKIKRIGSKVWMTQNLNFDAPGSECYNNNPANCSIYGKMYDWSTALTVAPPGWHLATEADWANLENTFGGFNIAGGALKATSLWVSPNTGATDSSGFTGLPAGSTGFGASFNQLGFLAAFWTPTEVPGQTYGAWGKALQYDNTIVETYNYLKFYKMSVRCVRN